MTIVSTKPINLVSKCLAKHQGVLNAGKWHTFLSYCDTECSLEIKAYDDWKQ